LALLRQSVTAGWLEDFDRPVHCGSLQKMILLSMILSSTILSILSGSHGPPLQAGKRYRHVHHCAWS
jgi:hypothetical protein